MTVTSEEKIIEVKNLTKVYYRQKRQSGFKHIIKDLFKREYEQTNALFNLSFEVHKGEIIGYIGPNGAGKTTTMKILSGILHPTSGLVKIKGFIPWERKKQFLMSITLIMGQKNQLWWDIPAMDTFLLFKEIYEIEDNTFRKRLSLLLEMLNAKNLINYPVRYLSMGERMKMELIAALIHDPDIILLDEPTIGLDVVAQNQIREFLKKYNQQFKKTIILTSHYMKDIETLATRLIFIDSGQIIYDGDIHTLISTKAPIKEIEVVMLKEGKIMRRKYTVNTKEVSNFLTQLMDSNKVLEIKQREPDLEYVARLLMEQSNEKT